MLHINDLSFRIAGRLLLEDATAHIPLGHKVGLIGRNGTGKSTLLKLITGELQPDGGTIKLRNKARLGILPQDAPSGPESLIETVLAADTERAALMAEADTATDAMRIAEIHTRLSDIDAHSAESRAARILTGLGFDHAAQQRPCASFSGGWRTRISLAATLFAEPDLLLLDEPSNYLDLEATIWLENFLKNYQRTLVIVSHDRDLLNNVVNTILHLDQLGLKKYSGNYDFFEKTRREQLALESAMHKKQELHRKHLQSFVDRFRAKATKARQAQSRIKMLEKMKPIASVIQDYTVTFNFKAGEELSSPILSMDECAVGYAPGDHVLKHLNLRIDADDRIALLGANGNGKSTFAKLIAGRLKAELGDYRKARKLKIGFFAQHQLEEMNAEENAYQHMAEKLDKARESEIRSKLGQFGFSKQKSDIPVAKLSGGEKARLNFCLLAQEFPHLMILDEPTNHLDVDSREALVQGLNAYEGAVLLISHDPHLVSLVADRLWLVQDGGISVYDGDMADYRKYVLDMARQAAKQGGKGSNVQATGKKLSNKEARKARAAARAALAPIRKKASALEKQIEKMSAETASFEALLAAPETYDKGPEYQAKMLKQLGQQKQKLSGTEEEWMAVLEEIDRLSAG